MIKLILLIATTILSLHQANETREFPFTETRVMPKMNKTVVSEGTMKFEAPDNLRMDYTVPAGDYTLIGKDKFDVFKSGKMQHLNVKDPKQKMAVYRATLLACLGGDVEQAAALNNAKAEYKTVGNTYVCTLKAENAAPRDIAGVELVYDKKNGQLLSMTLTEGNGNYTTYAVKK
jgi:outer membrane lipoprotein-sorting protein